MDPTHNYMTVYIGNPKESTQKFLEVISEFSKVERPNVNPHKPIEMLCTCTEQLRGTGERVLFIKAAREILTCNLKTIYRNSVLKFRNIDERN